VQQVFNWLVLSQHLDDKLFLGKKSILLSNANNFQLFAASCLAQNNFNLSNSILKL
jgi:hypothetical protein